MKTPSTDPTRPATPEADPDGEIDVDALTDWAESPVAAGAFADAAATSTQADRNARHDDVRALDQRLTAYTEHADVRAFDVMRQAIAAYLNAHAPKHQRSA